MLMVDIGVGDKQTTSSRSYAPLLNALLVAVRVISGYTHTTPHTYNHTHTHIHLHIYIYIYIYSIKRTNSLLSNMQLYRGHTSYKPRTILYIVYTKLSFNNGCKLLCNMLSRALMYIMYIEYNSLYVYSICIKVMHV